MKFFQFYVAGPELADSPARCFPNLQATIGIKCVCDLRNLSKLVKKLFHFGSGQDGECRVWLPNGSVLTGIVYSDLASFSLPFHFLFISLSSVSYFTSNNKSLIVFCFVFFKITFLVTGEIDYGS